MKICVIGLGYVGSVSCGCLAALGHHIVGVDINPEKVAAISSGKPPVLEPGLEDLVSKAVDAGTLSATTHLPEAVKDADAALICVGTPSNRQGSVQTGFLTQVCREIAVASAGRKRPLVVLNRSTCLPRVHTMLQELLHAQGKESTNPTVEYVCHPEFLREGVAVKDFYHPPKIVFGVSGVGASDVCAALYPGIDAPVFTVSVGVASLIKFADNCFHAVKITFANEIGTVAHELGVNASDVMAVFMADTKLNISTAYLRPGAPFGGSCLPKDLRAMLNEARQLGVSLPMLDGALRSNHEQIEQLKQRILAMPHRRVAVVGLAFKEHTDDVRESPMVAIVEWLVGKGSQVVIYDGSLAPERLVGANRAFALSSIPHLTDLMTHELPRAVAAGDLVVVSHRLTADAWASVSWRPDQRIIDMAGIPALAALPQYEGLYWTG